MTQDRGMIEGGGKGRSALLLALAAIALLPLLFYASMIFGGEEPAAADTISVRPFGVWGVEAQRSLGEVPQWIPHLFAGMPSYGSYVYTPANPLSPIDWLLKPLKGSRGMRYYLLFLLGGVSAFFLFRRQGVSVPAAAAAALGFVLTPYVPGVVEAGHSTKLRALMHAPLVLLALDLLLERPGPLAAAGLALSLAMLGWSNHPQIFYYAAMVAILYLAGRLLAERRAWPAARLMKLAAFLAASGAAAFLLMAEPVLAVREYAPYSIRGSSEGGGTGWDYATAWSFPPRELISFLFPEFFGLKGATYFGPLPFTQSTHYFGILFLAAVLLGFAARRDSRSWIWLGISLVILLVGFGEHFPVLYKPFYHLLPYFNRFRVPSMIYSLLPLTLGLLLARGLDSLPLGRTQARRGGTPPSGRRWYLAAGAALAIALIALVVGLASRAAGPSGTGWVRPGELQSLSPADLAGLRAERWDLRIASIVRGMILLGLFLGAVPLLRRLRPPAGAAVLGAILVVDLILVGGKFVETVDRGQIEATLKKGPEIAFLQAQEGPFRVLPIEEASSNRFAAFGVTSVGGYQPAKLRIYQDLLDRQLLQSPSVLSMLNVRYLLASVDPEHPSFRRVADGVYEYADWLPRAWFVRGWTVGSDREDALRMIARPDFDPEARAVFVGNEAPDLPRDGLPAREVRIEESSPRTVRLQVGEGPGPGLLVVSEIYYPPAWTATIDGRPAEILRTNHCLRALVVPEGARSVEMRCASPAFRWGRNLSRVGALALLALAGVGLLQRRRSSSR